MSTKKGFDRSKYKGTALSTLDKQEQELENKLPTPESNRADYHSIDDGKNFFRIYPAKSKKQPFIFPKSVSWLPQEVEEDAGKGKKKVKIKRKPIFNAKVHGNYEFDIVEEFQRIANRIVREECQDTEEANNKLWAINSWKDGIGVNTSWVCYASKWSDRKGNKKTFGRLELWDSMYTDMKKKAVALEDEDDAMTIDPFSDPDDGKLLVIIKEKKPDKNGKERNEYSVEIDFMRDYSLEDEELMKFDEFDCLSDQFVSSFKRSDFEKQLEGLRLIDEEHEYGVFEDEEFLDLVEKMESMIPEEEEEEGKSKKQKGSEQDEEQEESDKDLTEMSRKELKNFISENELPIKVTGKMSEEQIIELIEEELEVLEEKGKVGKETSKDSEEDVDNEEEAEEEEVESKLDKYRKKRSKK